MASSHAAIVRRDARGAVQREAERSRPARATTASVWLLRTAPGRLCALPAQADTRRQPEATVRIRTSAATLRRVRIATAMRHSTDRVQEFQEGAPKGRRRYE